MTLAQYTVADISIIVGIIVTAIGTVLGSVGSLIVTVRTGRKVDVVQAQAADAKVAAETAKVVATDTKIAVDATRAVALGTRAAVVATAAQVASTVDKVAELHECVNTTAADNTAQNSEILSAILESHGEPSTPATPAT